MKFEKDQKIASAVVITSFVASLFLPPSMGGFFALVFGISLIYLPISFVYYYAKNRDTNVNPTISPLHINKNSVACTTCGFIGNSKKVYKGSIFIEIILWLCFLIPGLIYSVWRSSSKFVACSKCNNSAVVPVDSPVGKKIYADSQAIPS